MSGAKSVKPAKADAKVAKADVKVTKVDTKSAKAEQKNKKATDSSSTASTASGGTTSPTSNTGGSTTASTSPPRRWGRSSRRTARSGRRSRRSCRPPATPVASTRLPTASRTLDNSTPRRTRYRTKGYSFELLKVLMTGTYVDPDTHAVYRANQLPDGTINLTSSELATNPASTLSLGQSKQSIAAGAEMPVIVVPDEYHVGHQPHVLDERRDFGQVEAEKEERGQHGTTGRRELLTCVRQRPH